MAEQDKKSTTINFAGREIDRKAFVDLAIEKANLWMDYQQLQGDERTDFVNNFNEIILGLVDNKYTTSEFGRLLHSNSREAVDLPEGYYRERDGERKNGEGKWYNSRRRGFNPIGNVETFLNGVAKLIPEYKEEKALTETESEPVKKKKWRRGMADRLIGDLIFGVGNEQDPTKNPEQVNAWADAHDPYENGKRSTDNRRIFINGILNDYLADLDNYEMSDAQRAEERKNIETLLNPNTALWQLNAISPLLSHLMFTGERYMTDEQKAELATLAAKNAYESGDPNATLETAGYTTPEAALTGYTRRIQNIENNWKSEFDLFNVVPETGSFTTKAEYNLNQENKNAVLSKNIQDFEKLFNSAKYPHQQNALAREYFNKFGDLIGDKYYIVNWDTGRLYEIIRNINSNNDVTVNLRSIKSVIDNKDKEQDLYNYLYNEYKKLKGYELPEYENGGILKFKDPPGAIPSPQVPEEPTKPRTTKSNIYSNIFPWWYNDPFKLDPSILDPNRYKSSNSNDLVADPNNLIADGTKNSNLARNNYDYSTEPKSSFGKTRPDLLVDALDIGKITGLNVGNAYSLNHLLNIKGIHKSPYRTEKNIFSDKVLLDAVSRTTANSNILKNTIASNTSSQEVANAAAIAITKNNNNDVSNYINQLNNSYKDLKEKIVDNENANFVRQWEVAEANHAADVALHNYKLQLKAEYTSRQARQNMLWQTGVQQGIAQSAKQNDEDELNWAILNDPEVIKQTLNIDRIGEAILLKQQELSSAVKESDLIRLSEELLTLKYERNLAIHRLNRALTNAQLNFRRTYRLSRGYPYALPSVTYSKTYTNPLLYAKDGGKVYYAEKEKTKRMYAKMLFDMMKMDMNHVYKASRDAYKDYRKIFMQQSK